MQAARQQQRRRASAIALCALALAALACSKKFEGGGDLRAQKVVLEREVEGYREAARGSSAASRCCRRKTWRSRSPTRWCAT